MEDAVMIMLPNKFNGTHKTAYLILFAAAIVYALISLVNHYVYRTYFNDLGLYTNAMFNYAHGNWHRSLLFGGGEHVDLWLILFSPLLFLFGSYTLLFLQIAFILVGGLGVYRFMFLLSEKRMLSLLAQVHFYFFFGILTALSFDYHSNVPAAMLVPWLFVYIMRERWMLAGLVFILIIIAKENMSFWMMFVTSGMFFSLLRFFKIPTSKFFSIRIIAGKKKTAIFLALLFVVSASYFIFLTQWFMPKYSYAVICHLNDYTLLGTDPITAVANFFADPARIVSALFTNHTGAASADYLKTEFLVLLLIAGGWILLVRPVYLWMCLPLFSQKLLTDNPQFWGLGGQYAVEFAPIIVIALYEYFSIQRISRIKLHAGLITLPLLLSVVASFRIMDNTHAFIDKAAIRFYQERHYLSQTSQVAAAEAFRLIPLDAPLSVQTHLSPHVALREKMYLFPEIKDAEYILLQLNGTGFYPLTKIELLELKDSLIQNRWKEVWEKDSIIVLQKKDMK
jgi:uncharacterized membrane protein